MITHSNLHTFLQSVRRTILELQLGLYPALETYQKKLSVAPYAAASSVLQTQEAYESIQKYVMRELVKKERKKVRKYGPCGEVEIEENVYELNGALKTLQDLLYLVERIKKRIDMIPLKGAPPSPTEIYSITPCGTIKRVERVTVLKRPERYAPPITLFHPPIERTENKTPLEGVTEQYEEYFNLVIGYRWNQSDLKNKLSWDLNDGFKTMCGALVNNFNQLTALLGVFSDPPSKDTNSQIELVGRMVMLMTRFIYQLTFIQNWVEEQMNTMEPEEGEEEIRISVPREKNLPGSRFKAVEAEIMGKAKTKGFGDGEEEHKSSRSCCAASH